MQKTKIRQSRMGGIKKIHGAIFECEDGEYTHRPNTETRITIGGQAKYTLHDARCGHSFPFDTLAAALAFSRRRRHGRSLEEHRRAELLQGVREMHGWSVADAARALGVSPRTIEAWSSGARAMPRVYGIVLEQLFEK